MQQPMQPILQHLFQASSLDDISRQQLEAFVEEHPAFGIGHYLLSRKLKAESSDQYAQETQKTCLYFPNPFWLQWQLDNVALAGGHAEHVLTAEPVYAAAAEPVHSAPAPPEVIAEPAPAEPVPLEAAPFEPAAESSAIDAAAEPIFAEAPAEPEEPVHTSTSIVAVAEESLQEPSAADQLLRSIEEARGLRENLEKINTGFDAGPGAEAETASAETEEPAAEEPATEEPATEVQPAAGSTPPAEAEAPIHDQETPIHDQEAPFVLDEAAQAQPEVEAEPIHDQEPPFVLDEADAPPVLSVAEPVADVQEPAASVAAPEAQSPVIPTLPGQPAETDLVFEPYHTIDYFASQGIKFTLEENPSDTLGKQLRSFTEWLKSMRRLPQKDREVVPDRVAEEAVQTKAAHSIENREVFTEAMAEVLAKQGMRERARAVYEKLSLLNPDKRAYFAAKIEQLNIF
jgi:hypothetical protein